MPASLETMKHWPDPLAATDNARDRMSISRVRPSMTGERTCREVFKLSDVRMSELEGDSLGCHQAPRIAFTMVII